MPTRTTPTIKNECSVRRGDSHVPGTREGTPLCMENTNDKPFFLFSCHVSQYTPTPPEEEGVRTREPEGGEAGLSGPLASALSPVRLSNPHKENTMPVI